MAKRTVVTASQDILAAVPLPNHGGRYATISHKFIIDEVLDQLQTNGFVVDKEKYRMSAVGDIAQGVYYMNYGNDEDLGLMFAWGNSYNKLIRFRCAVGAYVFVCDNGIIAGDMSNYGRKHLGDAKQEVKDHIASQIASANSYYAALVKDKDHMKTITLSETEVAELIGILFFKENVFSSSFLNIIRDQYKNPSFDYNANSDSLWTIYNHITYALKKAHPRTWMEQQKKLHALVKSMYFTTPVIATPVIDPNQLDLVVEAEKAEAEAIEATLSDITSEVAEEVIEENEVLSLEGYIGEDEEIEEDLGEVVNELPNPEGDSNEELDTDELLSSEATSNIFDLDTYEADDNFIPQDSSEANLSTNSNEEEEEMKLMAEAYLEDVTNGEHPEVTVEEAEEEIKEALTAVSPIEEEEKNSDNGTTELPDFEF